MQHLQKDSVGKSKTAKFDDKHASSKSPERGGMAFILVVGLALLAGGLLLVWKTNAFDISRFCEKTGFDGRVAIDLIFIFHLPWLAGAWMIGAAAKYFFRKGRPDPTRNR